MDLEAEVQELVHRFASTQHFPGVNPMLSYLEGIQDLHREDGCEQCLQDSQPIATIQIVQEVEVEEGKKQHLATSSVSGIPLPDSPHSINKLSRLSRKSRR